MNYFKAKSNLIKIAIAVFLIILLLFSMVCCVDEPPQRGQVTVVVTDQSNEPQIYTVDLDTANLSTVDHSVMDVLIYLKQQNKLTHLEYSQSLAYGCFITQINDLTAGDNTFISIYTSVTQDFDTGAYAIPIEYNGVTICPSGCGISSMKLLGGATYYFTLSTF